MSTGSSAQKRREEDHALNKTSDAEEATIKYPNRTGSPCCHSPICPCDSISFLPDQLLLPARTIQHGVLDSPLMNTRSSAQKRRGDDHAFNKTSNAEEATIKYPNQKSRKSMNEDELLLILVERPHKMPNFNWKN